MPPAEARSSGAVQASSAGHALGPALFVAMLLFYMITLTPFVDLTAAASADPAADRSSSLNQMVFLGLTACMWGIALAAPTRALVAQPRVLLTLILVWFAAVSAVSAHPDLALKRVVLAALTCVNASVVLFLPRSEEQFARLLSLCCVATLALAYLGVVLLPRLAIHQVSEIREPMNAGLWRGHFAHKNTAAATMVLIAFVGLYAASTGRRIAGFAMVALAALFLVQTGGKTSGAALPAILGLAWLFERYPSLRIPLVVGGIVAINLVTLGSAALEPVRGLVASLGIDPTFTNRTDIWRVGVAAALDRPLTGHGFQLFWQTDELVYAGGGGASWAVAAFNGHNAYLDAAVTTGLPGLALTVLWLVVLPMADVARCERGGNAPELTRLFMRIWLYGVFTGCVESLFFQSGSLLWFAMLFSVFGLRLQARARGVRTRPEDWGGREVGHA